MPKQTINIILTAVVFFALGYSITFLGNNTFQVGWDAAEQRLAETNFSPMFSQDMEILTVSGTIQEIKDNKITLKIQALEPLADSELDTRVVEINKVTKLYKLVEKDLELYQKEYKEFNESLQDEGIVEFGAPPTPFTKEEIVFDEIAIGQWVVVTADKDIKEVKEFEVTEILVQ